MMEIRSIQMLFGSKLTATTGLLVMLIQSVQEA